MFWKKKVKPPSKSRLIIRTTDQTICIYTFNGEPKFSEKALRPFVRWYFGRLQSSKFVLKTATGVDVLEREKIAHISLERVADK